MTFLEAQYAGTHSDQEIDLQVEPCHSDMLKRECSFEGSLICLSLNQPNVKEIDISTFEDIYPIIYFKACDTTAPGNTCAPQEEIEETLKNSWFTFFTMDLSIDPNKYDDPISKKWRIDWFTVAPDMGKVIDLYLKHVEFITDNGWILDEDKSRHFIMPDKLNNDIGDFAINNGAFVTFDLATQGRTTIYKRSYPKLQDVLANVVGLVNTIVVLCGVFAGRFFEFKMYEGIINDAFILKMKPEDTGPISRRRIAPSLIVTDISRDNDTTSSAIKTEQNLCAPTQPQRERVQSRPIQANIELIDLERPNNSFINKRSIPPNSDLQAIEEVLTPRPDSNYTIPMTPQFTFPEGPKDSSMMIQLDETMQHEQKPGGIDEEEMRRDLPPLIHDRSVELNTTMLRLNLLRRSDQLRRTILDLPVQKVKVGYFQWVSSLWKEREDVNYVERARDIIEDQLDILSIFKKLKEIDKLKYLLLTKEQKILFDNLHKPILYASKSEMTPPVEEWAISYHGKRDLLEDAYGAIKDKLNKTAVDEKILLLYETSLY